VKEESVHLSSWPKADRKKIDKNLEKNFEVILQIIEKGFAERDEAKIGLRWPLAKAKIISKDCKLKEEEKNIIKNQLNVKKVEFQTGKELNVEFDTNITPELESEGYARELSRKVQDFRKKLGLEKKNKIKLYLIIDEKFKEILGKNLDFIARRTNSTGIEIVESEKRFREKFKNKTEFTIKDKKGGLAVIITGR